MATTNGTDGGCPMGAEQNVRLDTQCPGLSTDDPVEAMNAGNHAQAIELLELKVAAGTATQADLERLALSKFEVGDPKGAAKLFGELSKAYPQGSRAAWWKERAAATARAAMNGESELRESAISDAHRAGDVERAIREFEQGPNADIVDLEKKELDVYVPQPSFMTKAKNTVLGVGFDAFYWVSKNLFTAADAVLGGRDSYRQAMRHGLWTKLPTIIGLLRLGKDRDDLLAGRNIPESMKAQSGRRSSYTVAHPGSGPGGLFTDPEHPNAGAVGQPIPIHGGRGDQPNGFEHLLPSAAEIAQSQLYASGERATADHLNALAIDHLFDLPHDVLMPAFDDHKKVAIPVAPGSPEAELGIERVWIRANEVHPETKAVLSSTTNAWDGSPDRGSTAAAVKRMRTDPASGKMVPGGKIYLDDGKWLPEDEHESGAKTIRTGITQNMSLGVTLVRTLYVNFHNWVCDALAKRHPQLTDNQLYWKAANITIQVRAKVHTAFWTPMLFGHEITTDGLHGNQFGLLENRKPLRERLVHDPANKGDHEVLHGLAGNATIAKRHKAPELKGLDFSETYRPVGHAAQPDGFDSGLFEVRPPGKPNWSKELIPLVDTIGSSGNQLLRQHGVAAVAHALMNTSMGAFELNNYPPEFTHLATAGGTTRIGETDVLRGMERGTGNYNNFLERLNIPGIKSYREMFKEPDSPKAQERIAEWERLFGEYNKASGEVYLTTGMGQLGDEFRPDGYAVPNPTFINFLMEASTRFMLNEWLTTFARPEHVTPTGANIVNAVTFEHLLALFGGDQLREYLEHRERPNVFSNMATNIPHPIEAFVDFGEENLHDLGAGAPYLKAHWTGAGLDKYEIYRLHEGGKSYLVDMTDRQIYIDHDGDGRIRAADAVFFVPDDGPSEASLFAKAEALAQGPGRSGKLSVQEVRLIKQSGYDKNKVGVAV